MRTKALGLLSLAVLVFGCRPHKIEPQRQAKVLNETAEVEVLFTDDDGYTVKRFIDKGHTHYYVTPGGAEVGYEVTVGDHTEMRSIRTAGGGEPLTGDK